MEEKNKKVRLKNMLAFGTGDLYGGGSFFIIGALFLYFLTDVGGIRPIYAGLVITIGKIWDAVTDPVMGFISDHTKSRFGRRRLYFLIGIFPVLLSFLLLWISFDASELVKVIYYTLAYVFFSTIFTMVMVPYNAMPAEMSQDYKERSNMISVRMVFSQISALLGALLPRTIIGMFANEAAGFSVMGLIFGIVYALPWFIVYKGTWESGNVVDDEKTFAWDIKGIFKTFFSTAENRALRTHIIMYICAYVTMDIFNALFLYFVRDYLNKEAHYQILLGSVLIFQVLSLFIITKECAKSGNAKTYRRHILIWFIGILSFVIISNASTPLWALIAIAAIVGVGLSGGVMIPYNMLAFVIDADEMITSERREGIYAGVMTFLRKIAQALALFLVGLALDLFGYDAGAESVSLNFLQNMRILFVAAPIILLGIGFITSFRFRITPKNHNIMMREIERLKNGGRKADADEQTKKVVKDITGIEYEDLWRTENS